MMAEKCASFQSGQKSNKMLNKLEVPLIRRHNISMKRLSSNFNFSHKQDVVGFNKALEEGKTKQEALNKATAEGLEVSKKSVQQPKGPPLS